MSATEPAAGPQVALRQVVVVGAGLIGTSVALALRAADVQVWLHDQDAAHVEQAVARGAGQAGPAPVSSSVDLVVLAVPIPAVAHQVRLWQQRYPNVPITDVSSAVSLVRQQANDLGVNLGTFVSGHPMAGGEGSGPACARAHLFIGRAWFILEEPGLDPQAVAAVAALVQAAQALPVRANALEHDQAVALTSHVPHLFSALLAGQLSKASPLALRLAGPALREMTRVAAASPALWAGIIEANAAAIAAHLRPLAQQVLGLAQQLEQVAEQGGSSSHRHPGQISAVDEALSHGVAGRGRLL